MRARLVIWVVLALALGALAQPAVWKEEEWQQGLCWTWTVRPAQTAPYQVHAYVLRLERLLDCEAGVLAFVYEEAEGSQVALLPFLRRPGQWPPYIDLFPGSGALPPFLALAFMLPELYPGREFRAIRAEEHLWGEQMWQVEAAGDRRPVRLPGGLVVMAHVFHVQHFAGFQFEAEDLVSLREAPPPELAGRISVEEWREGLAALVELLERGVTQRWELAVGFKVGWPVELKVYLETEEGEEELVWAAKLVGIEVLTLTEVGERLEAALEHAVFPTEAEAVRAALEELLPDQLP